MPVLLSACGVIVSILVGVIQNLWLKKPIYKVRSLMAQLTRVQLPAFKASASADAMATTIAKVMANQKNRELFEQSRLQTEELASQEKVFRKKLETLEKEVQAHLLKEEQLNKEIEGLK